MKKRSEVGPSWDDPLVSRGDKITVVSSRANLQITTIYSIDFNDVFSQLTRYFVTKRVDSDGHSWTGSGLVFGHNLDYYLVIFVGERIAVGFVGLATKHVRTHKNSRFLYDNQTPNRYDTSNTFGVPMSTQDIVQKLWNFCNVLRDDGITYQAYVTELTYLLFLKMAQRQRPKPETSPEGYRWQDLCDKELKQMNFYRTMLIHLGSTGSARIQAIYANAHDLERASQPCQTGEGH